MNKFLEKLTKKNNDIYNSAPVTIGFIGDSVTHGCFEIYEISESAIETVYDYDKAYSYKLLKILKTLYPSAQINLINAGISGDRAPVGASRIERDLLHYNPDLVVVCFGLNDSSFGRDKVSEYTDGLRGIFEKLKARDIPFIFMTPNMMSLYSPYNPNKHITDVQNYITSIQTSGDLDFYIDHARALAKEMNVTVCDCYAKWKKMNECGVDTTALLSNHCNHPTRDMHWLFATSLVETIFEM